MSLPEPATLTEKDKLREVLAFFNVGGEEVEDYLADISEPPSQAVYEHIIGLSDSGEGERLFESIKSSCANIKETLLQLYEDVREIKKDPTYAMMRADEKVGMADKVVVQEGEVWTAQIGFLTEIIELTIGIMTVIQGHGDLRKIGLEKITDMSDMIVNYESALSLMSLGFREYKQGNQVDGALLMTSGTAQIASDIGANIALAFGHAGATLASGLIGFSYVGVLASLTVISTRRMYKAKREKEKAEDTLLKLDDEMRVVDKGMIDIQKQLDENKKAIHAMNVNIEKSKDAFSPDLKALLTLYDEQAECEAQFQKEMLSLHEEKKALSEDTKEDKKMEVKLFHLYKRKQKLERDFHAKTEDFKAKLSKYTFSQAEDQEAVNMLKTRYNLLHEKDELEYLEAQEMEKKEQIEKDIKINFEEQFKQHAIEEDHGRAAKEYAAATVLMGTIAVVSFLALSGVTFGAMPAATVVLAGVAFGLNLIRERWGLRDRLSKSFTEIKAFDLIEVARQLPNHQMGIDLDKPFSIKDTRMGKLQRRLLGKHSLMTFREYFNHLIINDPYKARKVLEAYKNNDEYAFKEALRRKRSTPVVELEGEFYKGIVASKESSQKLVEAYCNGGINGIKDYLDKKQSAYEKKVRRLQAIGNKIFKKTGIKAFRSIGLNGAELAAYQLLDSKPDRLSVIMQDYTKKDPNGRLEDLSDSLEDITSSSDRTTGARLFKACKAERKSDVLSSPSDLDEEEGGEGMSMS